jgi:hypothetical protein
VGGDSKTNKCEWEMGKTESISECFKNWCLDRVVPNHKALQCAVAGALWLAKNEMIFQGKDILLI